MLKNKTFKKFDILFSIKLLLSLSIISLIIITIIIFSGNKNILLSRLDPNYWINELNKPNNTEYDLKLGNLINLSKNNDKYLSKSLINFIYYYDKLKIQTKREILNYYEYK